MAPTNRSTSSSILSGAGGRGGPSPTKRPSISTYVSRGPTNILEAASVFTGRIASSSRAAQEARDLAKDPLRDRGAEELAKVRATLAPSRPRALVAAAP